MPPLRSVHWKCKNVMIPTQENLPFTLMADALDNKHALSARAHIEAAKATPSRRALELEQARSLARLIKDSSLREIILIEIRQAQ